MSDAGGPPVNTYDSVAPRWGDKMRTLGYYDAYLGFLTAHHDETSAAAHIVDVGAGTAAFSEAWVASHPRPRLLTLLDPSLGMLERGQNALRRRGVEPCIMQGLLGDVQIEPADVALAAHVIEHCGDPEASLREIGKLLRPGGSHYLVVSKPHWCNAIIWLQWRHRTFRSEQILELVRAAGFDIERTYAFPAGPPSRTSQGIVATRAP